MNSYRTSVFLAGRKARGTHALLEDLLPVWGALLIVGGVLLMGAEPSVAQTQQPQDDHPPQSLDQRIEASETRDSPSELPHWAEPSSSLSSRDGSTLGGENATTNAPAPPSDPSQVPVDSGLALLAVAGAGYAVRKLHEEDEEG